MTAAPNTNVRVPVQVAVASGHRHLGGRSNTTMTGGAIAAERFDQLHPGRYTYAYSDVDFFHSSMAAMIGNVELLLGMGAVPLDDNERRKLMRWKAYDEGNWETNSIRMETIDHIEFNLVYKTIDKKPLRTPLEQTNSFDFSHLGGAYDMETGTFYDLANYYWPGMDKTKIRLFPDREAQWRNGSISRHTGLRQAGRYASNAARDYELELCKEPLVSGYRITGEHYLSKDDEELNLFGFVYMELAQLIEEDGIDELLFAYKNLNPYSKVQSLADALPRIRI